MKRFFAVGILTVIAILVLCMVALIVCASWLLILDSDSRNRLVTEVGVNPAWKDPQFILIQTGIPLVWLASVIICLSKGKPGSALVGIVAGVAQEIGLPPIGGIYILNLIYPLWVLPFFGALRLAHPESYYAFWFYRRNLHKYWRAVERFGLIEEYATLIAGDIEVSRAFELFLRRKPERRLSGLKETLMFIIDLPFRFVFVLFGFTFFGLIGWLGIVLIALKLFHVIGWPWWVAALPLEYGVLYCLYMTVDGALYRVGWKDIGGYARFTASDEELAHAEVEQVLRNLERANPANSGGQVQS
jgi:hypothetical protein